MNQGLPYRHRRARAIALSHSIEVRRKAAVTRVALTLTGAALALQALFAAHAYLASSYR